MFFHNHLEPLSATSDRKPGTNRNTRYKCKFCGFSSPDKKVMGAHYENKHHDLIPEDTDGYRYFYWLLTGKERGSCIMCKEETEFNRETMKYARFCKKEACKAAYRKQFVERMIGKYGKIHLLDDPEMQKKMLANRKISGTYKWSDGKHEFTYTGTYELDFLKYLDETLSWNPDDLMSPSPHTYQYKYQDKDHFYMPDFFIPSINCEIEIKSSERTERQNPDSREKDKLKDELMRSNSSHFLYIKILNKDYSEFNKLIKDERS